MRPIFTKPFVRDYQQLSPNIQKQFDKKLELLLQNPRHPSLRSRIVDKKRRIWKANIDGGYRFTFQMKGGFVTLRAIGPHEEMKRAERW